VDYYEATNHIPPYANATYYPGGAGGTAANYFLAARGLCQFHPDRAAPAGCTLNADSTISYVNPAPPAGVAWTCPSPNTWVSRAYAAPDRFTANQY